MTIDVADLAYMAGILDGEGCITAYRRKYRKTKVSVVPEVTVGICSEETIDWMCNKFPVGRKYKKKTPTDKNWDTCYLFHLSQRQVISFLTPLIPFLKIKKKQAELLVELAEIRKTSRPCHTHDAPRQLAILEEVQNLNRKGRRISST